MSGAALDISRATGVAALPWLVLLAGGLASALAVRRLERSGRLAIPEESQQDRKLATAR